MPAHLLTLPDAFAFATATAAYHIKGAVAECGRGPLIWDAFSNQKYTTHNGNTGDVTDDHYHRFEQDIVLMAKSGFWHYLLCLSWSRFFPDGRTAKEGRYCALRQVI